MSVMWLALAAVLAGGLLVMLLALGVLMSRRGERAPGFGVLPSTSVGSGARHQADAPRRTCPRPGCGEVPSVEAHYCPRCGVLMSSPEGKSEPDGGGDGGGEGGEGGGGGSGD